MLFSALAREPLYIAKSPRLARSGGDIEHSVSARYFSGGQHGRHEKARPKTDVPLVRKVSTVRPGAA
jgi:hypothetical protein